MLSTPSVTLPSLDEIRGRLTEIDREAEFLRKLLRLVAKRPSSQPTAKLPVTAQTANTSAADARR